MLFDFVTESLLWFYIIIVVVISEDRPVNRHWIVTAYMARRLSGGEIKWQRK